ncbi:MAG: hypothetical protein ACKO3W_01270 [bacterium]
MRDSDPTSSTPGKHPSPAPTREELLEFAAFEMLGVLDEVDVARFERALADAAPSVQAEVAALQERIATDPLFRDESEAPSAALRLRTKARLLEEIELEMASAAPIATIGPRGGARVRRDEPSAITADSMREILAEVAARNAHARPQKQLFWRVASLFLLAALCVALYFNQQLSRTAMQLAASVNERVLSPESLEAARDIAPFDMASARHIDLPLVFGQSRAHTHALLQPSADGGQGRLLVQGIGAERRAVVRVVVKDREGKLLETRQVNATEGGLFAAYLDVDALPANGVIEVEFADGATFRANYAV